MKFSSCQPLWLPEGSVRAFVAISIIVASFIYFWYTKNVSKELLVLDTFVVTYYFKDRENRKSKLGHWKVRYRLNEADAQRETIISGETLVDSLEKFKDKMSSENSEINLLIDHYERLD